MFVNLFICIGNNIQVLEILITLTGQHMADIAKGKTNALTVSLEEPGGAIVEYDVLVLQQADSFCFM